MEVNGKNQSLRNRALVAILSVLFLAVPAHAENKVVDKALSWLAAHQDKDGKWDCDNFMKHDPQDNRSSGPGFPVYDVGVTGLSLLAFIGAGYSDAGSPKKNPYADTVKRGLHYLIDTQWVKDGFYNSPALDRSIYNHVLATLAMCEACRFFKCPEYEKSAQHAVQFIEDRRNPDMGWRYGFRDGHNDTSVTCWCILALESARRAELKTEPEAFKGALRWVCSVTDTELGCVGYSFPKSEHIYDSVWPDILDLGSRSGWGGYKLALNMGDTADGILIRTACGERLQSSKQLEAEKKLLLTTLPEWSENNTDMMYWTLGTIALQRCGGRWRLWSRAIEKLIPHQDHNGSWPPEGAWGKVGGRVYSTAMLTLTFETIYRNRFNSPYRAFGVAAH